MLPGYHRFLRNLAGAQTVREADIPEPQLGIDFAEIQYSMPLVFRYEGIRRPVDWENALVSETYEEIARGPVADPEDFPAEGWLGEGIVYGF